MSEDKITYEDVKEYEHLFTLVPSFLLERFARKNKNLVLKFQPAVQSRLNALDDVQRKKLDIILNSDTDLIQSIMREAYEKTNIKQYGILANPKYKGFIELNFSEIRKLIE